MVYSLSFTSTQSPSASTLGSLYLRSSCHSPHHDTGRPPHPALTVSPTTGSPILTIMQLQYRFQFSLYYIVAGTPSPCSHPPSSSWEAAAASPTPLAHKKVRKYSRPFLLASLRSSKCLPLQNMTFSSLFQSRSSLSMLLQNTSVNTQHSASLPSSHAPSLSCIPHPIFPFLSVTVFPVSLQEHWRLPIGLIDTKQG